MVAYFGGQNFWSLHLNLLTIFLEHFSTTLISLYQNSAKLEQMTEFWDLNLNMEWSNGAFHVSELVLELDFCIPNQISKHREITNFCNPSKKIHRISATIKDSGTKPWFSYVEYSTYEIEGFSVNKTISSKFILKFGYKVFSWKCLLQTVFSKKKNLKSTF